MNINNNFELFYIIIKKHFNDNNKLFHKIIKSKN